ncbi:MAG TPA: Flp pilus assembly protein CpaB [Sphingobium sp.]|nr:Flp pilus assembly protein CpaB [Sphingobium sp.]
MSAALIFLVLGIAQLRREALPVASAAAPAAAAPRSAPPVAVLATAAQAIATGDTITAAMIHNAPADPARFPGMAMVTEVVGKVATQDVAKGAMIPRAGLDLATKLAIRVPVGMRAISIDTTAEIAVAGLVQPGDRVDVQAVYPGTDALSGGRGDGQSRAGTLLQMVQVLAVGDLVVGTRPATGGEGDLTAPPPAPPARTVTLALSPEQVSTLSLAKATGSLYLSLRNPADQQEVALVETRSAAPPVRAAPAPAPVAPQPRRAARAKPQAIELVMGGHSELIYAGENP